MCNFLEWFLSSCLRAGVSALTSPGVGRTGLTYFHFPDVSLGLLTACQHGAWEKVPNKGKSIKIYDYRPEWRSPYPRVGSVLWEVLTLGKWFLSNSHTIEKYFRFLQEPESPGKDFLTKEGNARRKLYFWIWGEIPFIHSSHVIHLSQIELNWDSFLRGGTSTIHTEVQVGRKWTSYGSASLFPYSSNPKSNTGGLNSGEPWRNPIRAPAPPFQRV